MVYLKALHSLEWVNFCERLGVADEAGAWAARCDALGDAISGEMEVRLWASFRGQTLARTIVGFMQHARALRCLATVQLELEYSAIEERRSLDGLQAREPRAVEDDAALAAVWFVSQNFEHVVACQRYFEHGEEDVRRRSDVDWLLLQHPLVSVCYFESGVSAHSSRRRLMTACRTGQGVRYRLPAPGNPIVDGLGEGKPENQNCAMPFLRGRSLQCVDMNQDAYLQVRENIPHTTHPRLTARHR